MKALVFCLLCLSLTLNARSGSASTPAGRAQERPLDPQDRTFNLRTFNGLAQVLIQSESEGSEGSARVTVCGEGLQDAVLDIDCTRR